MKNMPVAFPYTTVGQIQDRYWWRQFGFTDPDLSQFPYWNSLGADHAFDIRLNLYQENQRGTNIYPVDQRFSETKQGSISQAHQLYFISWNMTLSNVDIFELLLIDPATFSYLIMLSASHSFWLECASYRIIWYFFLFYNCMNAFKHFF